MKRGQFNQLSFEERFWLNVAPADDAVCWPWLGYVGSRGYGYIKRNYSTRLAHRVSFELYHCVHLRSDECVCHKCDNPVCVNPTHLFLGSHKDNAEDRNSKGREAHPTGEKHPMAKLTESLVREIRLSDESGRAIARRLGVSPATICNIRSLKTWPHVSMYPAKVS